MVNFSPLAAEIISLVWDIPANFNGFRVLAALLHGTPLLGASQTLWRWTEGTTYIRQGGHHVGHWPTFLASCSEQWMLCELSVACSDDTAVQAGVESTWHSRQDTRLVSPSQYASRHPTCQSCRSAAVTAARLSTARFHTSHATDFTACSSSAEWHKTLGCCRSAVEWYEVSTDTLRSSWRCDTCQLPRDATRQHQHCWPRLVPSSSCSWKCTSSWFSASEKQWYWPASRNNIWHSTCRPAPWWLHSETWIAASWWLDCCKWIRIPSLRDSSLDVYTCSHTEDRVAYPPVLMVVFQVTLVQRRCR